MLRSDAPPVPPFLSACVRCIVSKHPRYPLSKLPGEYAYKPEKFDQPKIDAREEYAASVKASETFF